eukprot:Hpha_TRINITY_DN28014_c0_g1::TRINITY_DN28014_c0_g1_i1::g.42508::m.42508
MQDNAAAAAARSTWGACTPMSNLPDRTAATPVAALTRNATVHTTLAARPRLRRTRDLIDTDAHTKVPNSATTQLQLNSSEQLTSPISLNPSTDYHWSIKY